MSERTDPAAEDVLAAAPTVAGVGAVKRAVRPARRVFLVRDAAALAPKRVSKRAARELLDEIKTGDAGVVVTARVQGPDLVIRTLEWMGDDSQLVPPLEDLAVVGMPVADTTDPVEE